MIDWNVVIQTIVGPLIGAAITLYALRRGDRERLSAAIIWLSDYDPDHGAWNEPFLHVQNRSDHPIMIANVETRRGILLSMREGDEFPIAYEDPLDLDFPYRVEPGETWRRMLDSKTLDRVATKAWWLPKALGFLRVPYLKVRVKTMGGTSVTIDAADGTTWAKRPRWLTR